ncbi:MAG: glutathione S-transferase family protein [Alphaproteobacteria bacterium]|jgi:glutathione S-transferase
MKLYDWKMAPNTRRVRMFLAEKGIELEIEEVGQAEFPALEDDFLAKSPSRLAPVLELDDGTCIAESIAICRYLESLHPDPPLMGADPKSAAVIEMWERRAEAEGMQAVAELFRNSHPAFVDRGLPGWDEPIAQVEALVERGRARTDHFFKIFDDRLAESEYVGGDTFSVADITTLCSADFSAGAAQVPIPDDAVHMQRWHKAVSARPSASA